MNRLFVITLVMCALFSCTGGRRVSGGRSGTNQVEKLSAKVRLFHLDTDSSRIFFSLGTRKQDYYMLSDRSKFKAAYRLTYEIVQSENGKKTRLDSSSLKLVDLQPVAAGQQITAFIDTKLPENKNYTLRITIANLNNGARYENNIRFDKNNCVLPENIMILSEDGQPLLEKNYVHTAGNIYLRRGCEQNVTLKMVAGGTSYPSPPFGTDDFASKNNYNTLDVPLDKEGNVYRFSNLEKGVYLVSTGENTGVVFYHFNKWYPYSNDTSGFYEPLIYISTRDEFDKFKSEPATKSVFETYWINHAGDKASARKAINEYYKRVFEANAEFTSVQEGWRTDRGMIHIIFGKPGYIERQFNREVWIYRTAFNTSLSFTFNRIDNPFSDNDYRLERDLRYKPHWYNAAENWRRGKPFNLNGY